ncbi:hypothetical protein HK096_000819, partial [Nowakowskiella sp. JEL0078]
NGKVNSHTCYYWNRISNITIEHNIAECNIIEWNSRYKYISDANIKQFCFKFSFIDTIYVKFFKFITGHIFKPNINYRISQCLRICITCSDNCTFLYYTKL